MDNEWTREVTARYWMVTALWIIYYFRKYKSITS